MANRTISGAFRFEPVPGQTPEELAEELSEFVKQVSVEFGLGAHVALLSPAGAHYVASIPGWAPIASQGNACELSYRVAEGSDARRAEELLMAETYAEDLRRISAQLSEFTDHVQRAIGAGRDEIEMLDGALPEALVDS